ncbi:hypothetical protein H2O64_18970 [Kordia sp. YSTF-M3]|uniref:Prepilin type IV endopeptidase peptidase domain-containing protein n=1 Tax=Kordia aestuariivivens TaxID=2759037 RepID=A0ABR7QDW9_9FLAO|nr:hypothetical protein [Kordia aestuariivivens]MBC8756764.1 hypothetical protein [Kordia aestuariivivens]
MLNVLFVVIIGFITIAIFDAIGAILSRKLNFNYALLTIGSISIYATIAVYTAIYGGILIGIISSFLMGLFDATVGLKISEKFKANIPDKSITFKIDFKTVFAVSIFATVIGTIAILLIL